jgi:hypothetical protein
LQVDRKCSIDENFGTFVKLQSELLYPFLGERKLISTEKQAMFIKELRYSNCVVASEIGFLLYCLPVAPLQRQSDVFMQMNLKTNLLLGSVFFHGLWELVMFSKQRIVKIFMVLA